MVDYRKVVDKDGTPITAKIYVAHFRNGSTTLISALDDRDAKTLAKLWAKWRHTTVKSVKTDLSPLVLFPAGLNLPDFDPHEETPDEYEDYSGPETFYQCVMGTNNNDELLLMMTHVERDRG